MGRVQDMQNPIVNTPNCYMNSVARVSLHLNFRTHEFVEVLFLKRFGFDISLYQAHVTKVEH